MASVTLNRLQPIADVVSNILNLICPNCGGRMGGEGLEFKCQGHCRADWRRLWSLVRDEQDVTPTHHEVLFRTHEDADRQEIHAW
jgi:tRNA(Ile2) C34 agmatinyltransferase TiaS